MRVLITGGAGFIGSHTAVQLRARGHEARLLDSLHPQIHTEEPRQSPTWRAVSDGFDTCVADIGDRGALQQALDGCDAVLHLAAETGTGQSMYEVERYARVNVCGTATLLELIAARRERIQRVVLGSSRAIYGEGSYRCPVDGIVTPRSRSAARMQAGRFEVSCPACDGDVELVATRESAPSAPASVYAVTKLAQEQLVASVCSANGTPWIAARYQNVFGPGQSLRNPYTGVLSVFSRLMLAGESIEVFEDGRESRDFVYIGDVAAANCAALEASADLSGSFNVGSGRATSIHEVVRELARNYTYRGSVTASGRFRAGDIRHNLADVSELERVLGVRCDTPFAEGITKFCSWVRQELAGPVTNASQDYRRSLQELESRGLIR